MLTQQDHRNIPKRPEEIRLFSVVRNEELRLPYFLQYYACRGVDRFFFIDNDSTDATSKLLLREPNVHVFKAPGSFAHSLFGSIWIQHLLAAYGRGQWSVLADADELLVYPDWENLSIRQLCRFLSLENANALRCILVDMYSNKSFAETKYVTGTDLISACPYFESESILCFTPLFALRATMRSGEWSYAGGMRYRLFNTPVLLDKVGLIKYSTSMRLIPGQHGLTPAVFSELRGAMLHYKFLSDFHDRAVAEAARGEHWNAAEEYRKYAAILEAHGDLKAFGAQSRRFSSTSDLIECDIMTRTERYQGYVRSVIESGRVGECSPQWRNSANSAFNEG
jgi:hypothetical protein